VAPRSEMSRDALHALSSAVLAVTSHLSVEEVLQRIVTSARELLDAEYAALGVPDDQDSFAQFVVDGVSDEQWRAIGPLPRQHGLLGVMLREARPQRLDDIRADPRFWGWPAAHPELVGFLGVPIMDGQAILGAIYLANKQGGFTDHDEALLRVLAAHAAIALTNARLYERSRELTLVEERTRLARELHDAVAQKLFSLRLTAGAAAALVERDPHRAREELGRVQQLSGDALGELRSAIFELRPAELSDDGLVDTLRKHVEVLRRIHGVRIDWSPGDCGVAPVSALLPALPSDREDAVFRVAQEALQNSLRHSGAEVVSVSLRTENGAVVLEVSDDGRGFDVTATRQTSRRLGLSSMRARARESGGRLWVTSVPGSGTTVRLELPHE
jgi:signal transduction histidine kinase